MRDTSSEGPLSEGLVNCKKRVSELEAVLSRLNGEVQELREVEKKYNVLHERAGYAVFTYGADLRLNQLNRKACEMLGYSEEELLGRNVIELGVLHPDDFRKASEAIKVLLGGEEVTDIELRFVRKDGTTILTESIGVPLVGEDGKVKEILNIARDITERRRLEEVALLSFEERYRELLESITDSVYVLDREWRHVIVNQAGADFTGIPKERLPGNKLTELFPGVEETPFFQTFERVMETKRKAVVEGEYIFEDGRSGWYEVRVYPVPEGILCISTDITEKRRLLEELRQSEQLFRSLVENSQDLIAIMDSEGAYEYGSPSSEKLLGYRPEELIGRNWSELFVQATEEEVYGYLDILLEVPGLREPVVLRFKHKDGSTRIFEVVGMKLDDVPGRIRYLINAHDITDREIA
ncbi:MAG: PAS domain S-box protein, partial [Actinomycetota bacterium]